MGTIFDGTNEYWKEPVAQSDLQHQEMSVEIESLRAENDMLFDMYSTALSDYDTELKLRRKLLQLLEEEPETWLERAQWSDRYWTAWGQANELDGK